MATEATALVRIESLTAAEIFKPGAVDPIIEQIKAKARAEAAKLDISTEASRKAIASLAYKVARSKTFIDGQRKSLVEAEKKRLREIDREGARIWDELEALQKEVRKPLTEWEDADKRRIDTHEALLKETEAAGPFTGQAWQTLSVESMRERLAEISALSARDWQEFRAKAERIIAEACAAIESAIAKREKYDAEQAELARLRKEAEERGRREREERIAREAKERAEHEAQQRAEAAERAAKAEQERIERAAREREAAIQREKEAAEQRAKDAETRRILAEEKAKRDAKEAEERIERQRQEAIEAERKRVERERQVAEVERQQREANKRHRAKIDRIAADALIGFGFTDNQAQNIVALISEGKVPNVHISY